MLELRYKKILAFLLVLVLCISLFPFSSANAAEKKYMSLSSANGEAGDDVELTLNFGSDAEFAGLKCTIIFDGTVFEAKEANLGSYVSWPDKDGDGIFVNKSTAGNCEIAFDMNKEMSNVTKGDYSVTIKFHIKEDAKAGDYEIKFKNSSTCKFYDSKEKYQNLDSLTNGKITVEGAKVAAGNSKTGDTVYAWSYGGTVTPGDEGSFIIKPCQKGDVNYVIDSLVVNDEAVTLTDEQKNGTYTYTPPEGTTVTSVFATFAYTVNFNNPANGSLSVSRDGSKLTSGDIVHGGDVLTISCEGTTEGYALDELNLTGIRDNKDGTYTVIAQNGESTPAISASMKFVKTVSTPKFSIADGTVINPSKAEKLYITIDDAEYSDAKIYYTLDGSEPTSAGTLYTADGIDNFAGKTVKAVAVKENCNNSEIITASYTKAKGYSPEIAKNDEIKNVSLDYKIKINDTECEGTAASQYTDLYMSAYTGDTIKFKFTIPEGYKLLRVVIADYAQTADSDGWYTYTVSGKESSLDIYVYAYKLIDVSIASGIENGKVATNIDDFAGGYCEGDSRSSALIVTPVPDEGYRLVSGSLKYKYTDEDEWHEIPYISGTRNYWAFYPKKDVQIKAEFEKGEAKLEISNEDELRQFAEEVNAGNRYVGWTVTLTDDIKLTGEWTPIGEFQNTQREFNGVFDGQNHTISGLSINTSAGKGYYGLFGTAGDIKNLTVKGSINCSGGKSDYSGAYSHVGGIAADAQNITNCRSYVDITTDFAGYTGGLAGYIISASGCINYGDITIDRGSIDVYDKLVNEDVGGIAGVANAGITDSANYGDISFDAGTFRTGNTGAGLAGVAFDSDGSAGSSFGGIVGWSGYGTYENLANKGSITGDMRFAGGIIGNAGQYGQTLTNCYNIGSITSTGSHYPSHEIRLGGLVGSNFFCQSDLTLINCYNAGSVTAEGTGNISAEEFHANEADRTRTSAKTDAVFTLTNTYGSTEIDKITAENMGDGYAEDTIGISGGHPVLKWEADTEVSSEKFAVSFTVDPSDAALTVTDFKGNAIEPSSDGKYSLKMGTYYYKAAKSGYLDAEGSFTVTSEDKAIEVELYKKATVKFELTPSDANFTLTDSYGKAAEAKDGTTYELVADRTYTYEAVADGYNGISGTVKAKDGDTVKVELTKETVASSGEIYGDANVGKKNTITEGGTYKLGKDAAGLITIDTTENVTIVGSGTASSGKYENIYIKCSQPGSNLTLDNVYINVTTARTNLIDFNGKDNVLNFSGTNILELDTNASGYAMIHVNADTELTVTGGTAYLYKSEQGAGIGGNGAAGGKSGQTAETNGKITIKDAKIFAKGTKQGALIGAGANAGNLEPGAIIIENSELNLIANSRAAAVGGSAGSDGASKGADVTITDSIVNINVDYSGAAIGGGGYNGGNDSDGGTLKTSGSSIRTFIDTNAAESWGVDEPGVHENKAVTADVTDESGDNELYLAEIDTTVLPDTDTYEVKVDGKLVYSGGLHKYAFVNENYTKTNQSGIGSTIDNWTETDDNCLYIYMTGEKHDVTVNGYKVNVDWNPLTKTLKADTSEDIVKTLFDDINVKDDPEKIKEQLAKAEAAYEKLTDEQKANVASTVEAKLKELRDYEEQKAKKDEDIQKTTDKLAGEIDKVNAAGTGDTSSMMPALVIMLIAAAGAGTVVVTRRRRLH